MSTALQQIICCSNFRKIPVENRAELHLRWRKKVGNLSSCEQNHYVLVFLDLERVTALKRNQTRLLAVGPLQYQILLVND